MALDPDSVRVDLLRIKRKLFLSFPEGSKERQDFLIASKLSELGYLTKLADPETVDMAFAEYERLMKNKALTMLMGIGFGISLSVMMCGFHKLHPTSIVYSFFWLPGIAGLIASLAILWKMIDQWRKFQPFKKEYKILRQKIEKLIAELKGMVK